MDVMTIRRPADNRRHLDREPGFRSRGNFEEGGRASSVAIGVFDGVHLGHRQVLDGCDTALTFEPHPLHALAPDRAPHLLSDWKTKLRKLEAAGVRRVAVIRFDTGWSNVAAEDFISHVLIDQLNASSVSVGENFRFGSGGAGTAATLAQCPSLQVRAVPLLQHGASGRPVSSSRIRQLVSEGDVEQAAELLGAPLALYGLVVRGNRLAFDPQLAVPAPGEYLGCVQGQLVTIRTGGVGLVRVAGPTLRTVATEVEFIRRIR